MNIKDFHTNTNAVSAHDVTSSLQSSVKTIRILANEQLKEHISKVPALLICISGEASFEDENGLKVSLQNGDFVNIVPMVKHLVNATQDSYFLLIK